MAMDVLLSSVWGSTYAGAAYLWSRLDIGSASTIVAAFGAAGLTIRAARAERLAAKRATDLGTAFNVVAKVIKMFSYFRIVHGVIGQALDRMEEPGFNRRRPWEALQPFATLPSEVIFAAEETAFLLSTRVNALMLRTLELVDLYNDLLSLLRLYSNKRAAFMVSMVPTIVDGRIDLPPMDQEAALRAAPITIPLQNIFDALVDRAEPDLNQATEILNLLQAHCYERFGRDFPKMEIISVQEPATPPLSD